MLFSEKHNKFIVIFSLIVFLPYAFIRSLPLFILLGRVAYITDDEIYTAYAWVIKPVAWISIKLKHESNASDDDVNVDTIYANTDDNYTTGVNELNYCAHDISNPLQTFHTNNSVIMMTDVSMDNGNVAKGVTHHGAQPPPSPLMQGIAHISHALDRNSPKRHSENTQNIKINKVCL